MGGQRKLRLAHAQRHCLGQQVAAIWVVVGVVQLSRGGRGKRRLRAFHPERGVQGLAHLVEVDERRLEFARRLARGLGIVAERGPDPARRVEGAALDRRNDHRQAAARTGHVHVGPDLGLVGRERAAAAVLDLLLVVVPELHQEQVARLHHAQDLVDAAARQRVAVGLARLRVVRHRDLGTEEARQHLAPAVVRLARLVAHGRVAQQEDGRHPGRHDLDALDGVWLAIEFQGQALVPVPGLGLGFARRLEGDRAGRDARHGGDARSAHIGDEGAQHALSGRRRHVLEHQPAQLGFYRGRGRLRGMAKHDGDGVVALREADREIVAAILEAVAARRVVGRTRRDAGVAGGRLGVAEHEPGRRGGVHLGGQQRASRQVACMESVGHGESHRRVRGRHRSAPGSGSRPGPIARCRWSWPTALP